MAYPITLEQNDRSFYSGKAVVHEPHEKHEHIQMHTVVDAVTQWALRCIYVTY